MLLEKFIRHIELFVKKSKKLKLTKLKSCFFQAPDRNLYLVKNVSQDGFYKLSLRKRSLYLDFFQENRERTKNRFRFQVPSGI
jgi:hypothetical protein